MALHTTSQLDGVDIPEAKPVDSAGSRLISSTSAPASALRFLQAARGNNRVRLTKCRRQTLPFATQWEGEYVGFARLEVADLAQRADSE